MAGGGLDGQFRLRGLGRVLVRLAAAHGGRAFDYRLTDPEELWVEVGEGQTVSRTLHYAPLAPTGIRVFILPENAAQGGATWRVKDRTPADTWHGDGYIYTGITAQDVNRGCVEIEFTGATATGILTRPHGLLCGHRGVHDPPHRHLEPVRIGQFHGGAPRGGGAEPAVALAGTESWHTLADTAEAAVGSRTVSLSELEAGARRCSTCSSPTTRPGPTRCGTSRGHAARGRPKLLGGRHDRPHEFRHRPPAAPAWISSVVALTWQADHAAPQVLLDQDQGTYTLWAESANGAVRAALYYLKNPNTQETEGNRC